jgi:hypothetical protein
VRPKNTFLPVVLISWSRRRALLRVCRPGPPIWYTDCGTAVARCRWCRPEHAQTQQSSARAQPPTHRRRKRSIDRASHAFFSAGQELCACYVAHTGKVLLRCTHVRTCALRTHAKSLQYMHAYNTADPKVRRPSQLAREQTLPTS